MGLHTRFYSDKDKYILQEELYKKLDDHEEGINWLHDYELLELEEQIDKLDKELETNYHDCFRTNKRESNGEYTYDVIYSKEDCYKWLEDNKDTVYFSYTKFDSLEDIENYKKRAYELLNEFWNKYPNGVIDFG